MRYVRSRLKKIKSELDEKKFLMSNSYRLFLQRVVTGTTGRYDVKVMFADSVCTDNKRIYVNPMHPYLNCLETLSEKTLVVLGQLAHEIFHILYTDFKTLREITRLLKREGRFKQQQLHQAMNIIEDSAIELIGTNYYTGSFKQAIIASNKNALQNMPSLDELDSKGAPRLTIFKQACAMYCILGTQKGKIHDEDLKNKFKEAMPILDQGRLERDSWGRLEYAKKLYDLMLPLIEEVEKEGQEDMDSKHYEYVKSEDLSHGDSVPMEIPDDMKLDDDFSEKERKKTKRKMSKETATRGEEERATETSDSSDDSVSSGEDGASDTGGAGETKSDDGKSEESIDSDECEEETSGKTDDDSSSEEEKDVDRSDSEDKHESEDTKDASEEDKKLEEAIESLEEQLKSLEEDVAKEEYDKEEQRKLDKEIREFARSVKFADIHKGIRNHIIREFESRGPKSDPAMEYKRLLEEIKSPTRNLTRNLQNIIRYNEDVKLTGLLSGRVNKGQLYRKDKRVFYKRQEKSDEADLAVALLIDESGSMRHYERAQYAKLAAIMLYEVCDKLSIPFAAIGFDAPFNTAEVSHRHYVDFDSRSKKERYNLTQIRAREDNRDGFSIKHAGEYLKRREETDKILIVISDGLPEHSDYIGKVGLQDTARAVRELEGDGIQVYGLAIGEGKTEIKKIYMRNYIDIPNLKTLPNRLVRIIEDNLLRE